MNQKYIFFVDDFGTRTTCKGKSSLESPVHEFSFALGGVIVAEEDVENIAEALKIFCCNWNVPALHGNKIRSNKGKFAFLKKDPDTKQKFLNELQEIIVNAPILAHACVICRPGYRDRYSKKFTDVERWGMSKTAFDISVERAAKFAMQNNRVLDVVYERTGKKEDKLLERYFEDLKSNGTEFCPENSEKYAPLSNISFDRCLKSIWSDGKSNPLLQMADLIVHPLSQISSGKENHAYNMLEKHKLLLDFHHESDAVGIKYSCYDGNFGDWLTPSKNTQGTPKDPLRRSA